MAAARAIEAVDASVKSGNIELIEVRAARGMTGKCFVSMTGDVDGVKADVEAGARIAAEQGVLINTEYASGIMGSCTLRTVLIRFFFLNTFKIKYKFPPVP